MGEQDVEAMGRDEAGEVFWPDGEKQGYALRWDSAALESLNGQAAGMVAECDTTFARGD